MDKTVWSDKLWGYLVHTTLEPDSSYSTTVYNLGALILYGMFRRPVLSASLEDAEAAHYGAIRTCIELVSKGWIGMGRGYE